MCEQDVTFLRNLLFSVYQHGKRNVFKRYPLQFLKEGLVRLKRNETCRQRHNRMSALSCQLVPVAGRSSIRIRQAARGNNYFSSTQRAAGGTLSTARAEAFSGADD